jgi:ABC-type multidrug transport system fused ATPase/permease subunit
LVNTARYLAYRYLSQLCHAMRCRMTDEVDVHVGLPVRTTPSTSGNGVPDGQHMTSCQEAALSFARGLAVELRDVRFGYTTERQVVKGVSLSIQPGQSVAIVGPSGKVPSRPGIAGRLMEGL